VSVSVSSISKFDFIVTLHSLAKMSALMIGVSRALQRPGTNKLFAGLCWQTRLWIVPSVN